MESGRAWTPVWSRARNPTSMMQSPATGSQYKNCPLLPGKQNTPESCDSGAVLLYRLRNYSSGSSSGTPYREASASALISSGVFRPCRFAASIKLGFSASAVI